MVVCICSLIQNNSSSLRILARHVQTLIADPASPLTSPLTQHSGTHSQDRSSGKAAVVAGQKQKTQRSTPHPSESGRWDHHEPRLQAPGACSTVSATSLTKCKFKDKISDESQDADCSPLLWGLMQRHRWNPWSCSGWGVRRGLPWRAFPQNSNLVSYCPSKLRVLLLSYKMLPLGGTEGRAHRTCLYYFSTSCESKVIWKCCCCSVAQSCPTQPAHALQHNRPPCPSLSPSSLKLRPIESKIIYQKSSHICYFSENREGWGSGKETKSKIGRMKLNEIKILSGIQLDITS